MATQRFHNLFQLALFVFVASLISKDPFDTFKNISKRPDWLVDTEFSDEIRKECSFRGRNDAIRQNTGANARELIDCFADVVLEISANQPLRLGVLVTRSHQAV